jgi:hypothetical protein
VPIKDDCAVAEPDGEVFQAGRKGNSSDLSSKRSD